MKLNVSEKTKCEIWRLVNQFRWKLLQGEKELQQLWKSDTGETKWEAIPNVDENGNSKEK